MHKMIKDFAGAFASNALMVSKCFSIQRYEIKVLFNSKGLSFQDMIFAYNWEIGISEGLISLHLVISLAY